MSKLYKPSPKPLSSHCGAPQGVHTKAFADTANPNFGCFSPRSHCWVCAQQDMGEVFSDVELLSKASIPQSVQEHPVLEPSITSLWGPCKDLDPNLSSLHEFLYCLPYTHWWSPRWTNHLLFTITATCITSWIPFKSAPHHSMMTRWLFPWARGHGAHTISYSRVPHGLIKELCPLPWKQWPEGQNHQNYLGQKDLKTDEMWDKPCQAEKADSLSCT